MELVEAVLLAASVVFFAWIALMAVVIAVVLSLHLGKAYRWWRSR